VTRATASQIENGTDVKEARSAGRRECRFCHINNHSALVRLTTTVDCVSGEALLRRICVSMFRVERKLMAKSKRAEDLLRGIQLGAAGAATAVLLLVGLWT